MISYAAKVKHLIAKRVVHVLASVDEEIAPIQCLFFIERDPPAGERLSYDARPDRESILSGAADRTSPIEDHMTENVKTEIEAGIMTLTLSRADKKNALSHAMYVALSDGLERAEADATIRAILFQGDGDSFTAGNHISHLSPRSGGSPAHYPHR